jgi:hypothetical protein
MGAKNTAGVAGKGGFDIKGLLAYFVFFRDTISLSHDQVFIGETVSNDLIGKKMLDCLEYPGMVEYKKFYFLQKNVRRLFLDIFFHNF